MGAAVLFFFVGNVDNLGVELREIEKPVPQSRAFSCN
jgi:hypothetical protein